MALIKCPECGKDVSDTIESCIHCGYVLKKKEEITVNETESYGENDKKKKIPVVGISVGGTAVAGIIIVASIIILIICFVVGFLVGFPYVKKSMKYKEAMKLYSEGEYKEAENIFVDLGGFKDSEEKTKECWYKIGKERLNSGDYSSAVTCFERADDYSDSKDLLQEAKNKQAEEEEKKAQEQRKQTLISNLKSAYDRCDSPTTTLSSDGKSITVDSKNKSDYTSLADVIAIIDELDLPDSLFEEMKNTNALMGKQTETYDDYEVTWSYHPNNGLDVIFKIVE